MVGKTHETTQEKWARLRHAVAALRRRNRSDAGTTRAMSPRLLATLEQQYLQHSRWSRSGRGAPGGRCSETRSGMSAKQFLVNSQGQVTNFTLFPCGRRRKSPFYTSTAGGLETILGPQR